MAHFDEKLAFRIHRTTQVRFTCGTQFFVKLHSCEADLTVN